MKETKKVRYQEREREGRKRRGEERYKEGQTGIKKESRKTEIISLVFFLRAGL
jgi:hypothetical protein